MSIQELREKSGAGIVACSKALIDAEGNLDKALLLLRERGEAKADGYSTRTANNGVVGFYLHHDKTKGIMVQLNCETDFVARTPEFIELANNIAMHVMATNPHFINVSDIPEAIVSREKSLAMGELEKRGISGDKLLKALSGKLEKILAEKALLEQPFVIDSKVTVGQAVKAFSAKCGEKVVVSKITSVSVADTY